ncbi:hypothetical protein TSL6_01200 [Sulfurovum sp. TSL6]|uniref:hypothetical protein n=1 Tax=Sulfurovum sp. TSL6 TaxID=2826995 RepID=UPI001CC43E52|nr:hypothetical protein [Sulfurovum sp. TSL6]GIT99613.1 hypothetical protein TSL6_01200 [Sulfurovum sp. TSL6]
MEKIYQEKLEEIVLLLNDPDETVLIKEVKEKLENLLALVKNPEKIEKEKQENNKKLEKVVEFVYNAMANPDIELEYCIPEEATTPDPYSVANDPYIQVKYASGGTHMMNQNVRIGPQYLSKTPEDIANLVTFHIKQFIEEIDATEYGVQ